MHRNGYFEASGKNSDISVRFFDRDFLIVSEILAISGRFQPIFSSDKLNTRSTMKINPVIRQNSVRTTTALC